MSSEKFEKKNVQRISNFMKTEKLWQILFKLLKSSSWLIDLFVTAKKIHKILEFQLLLYHI